MREREGEREMPFVVCTHVCVCVCCACVSINPSVCLSAPFVRLSLLRLDGFVRMSGNVCVCGWEGATKKLFFFNEGPRGQNNVIIE